MNFLNVCYGRYNALIRSVIPFLIRAICAGEVRQQPPMIQAPASYQFASWSGIASSFSGIRQPCLPASQISPLLG